MTKTKAPKVTYTFTAAGRTFTETTARRVTHAVVFRMKDGSLDFWTTRDVRGALRDVERNGFRHVETVEIASA